MKKIIVKDCVTIFDINDFIEKKYYETDIENSPEPYIIDLQQVNSIHAAVIGAIFDIINSCRKKNISCQVIPPDNKIIRKFFDPILEVE